MIEHSTVVDRWYSCSFSTRVVGGRGIKFAVLGRSAGFGSQCCGFSTRLVCRVRIKFEKKLYSRSDLFPSANGLKGVPHDGLENDVFT